MAKFCIHEEHGGLCKKTGTYCNIGDCPYDEIKEFVPVVHACWIGYETMSWRHGRPKQRKYNRCSNCKAASAVRHKACPNCRAIMDADTQEREDA